MFDFQFECGRRSTYSVYVHDTALFHHQLMISKPEYHEMDGRNTKRGNKPCFTAFSGLYRVHINSGPKNQGPRTIESAKEEGHDDIFNLRIARFVMKLIIIDQQNYLCKAGLLIDNGSQLKAN